MTVLIIDKLNLLSFLNQVLSDHYPVRESPASDKLIHAIFKSHFWTVFGKKPFLLNQAQ